MSVYTYMNCI